MVFMLCFVIQLYQLNCTSLCCNRCLVKNNCYVEIKFYFGKLITCLLFPSLGTPHAPTLFPLAPCGSGTGDMVTLGCLATEFTPGSLTFSWTKSGDDLEDISYPPVQKGQYYMAVSQVQVSKEDWKAKKPFQCAVTHAGGNSAATVPHPEPRKTYPMSYIMLCMCK